MIEVAKLSDHYDVRALRESDADAVLALCQGNPLFYQYCEAAPTQAQVLSDMRIAPPGISRSHKHFVGYYEGPTLVAAMDLVDGYPEPDIAYIGFFMMDSQFQSRGIGSAIIREAETYLKSDGKTAVRLAINKGNPQSTHFWMKNGFAVIREVGENGRTLLEAEHRL